MLTHPDYDAELACAEDDAQEFAAVQPLPTVILDADQLVRPPYEYTTLPRHPKPVIV